MNTDQRHLAETLLGLNIGASQLSTHLRETCGKQVTHKDIHNIRQQMRTPGTEAAKVLDVLEKFLHVNPGNLVHLSTNNDDELVMIYIQDQNMQQTLSNYPEVLIVDCTYCTNNCRMPLISIVVVDGDSHGQVVAQALIANETKEVMHKFFQVFKENNPVSTSTSMFLIDKDFTEFSIISELWPTASVFYCLFHVLKAFKSAIHKLQGISKETKEEIKTCCQHMAYAKSETLYDECYAQLMEVASPEFITYFQKNWHSCTGMWVQYERIKCMNLGQRTTNLIESYHQKIKDHLHANMPPSESLDIIIKWSDAKQKKLDHDLFLSQTSYFYYQGDDTDVAEKVHALCTPYAADIVQKQLLLSRKVEATIVKSLQICNNFTVSVGCDEYSVILEGGIATCTCMFNKQMNLPCRHIFAVDQHNGTTQFNEEWFPPRWRKSFRAPSSSAFITSRRPVSEIDKIEKKKTMTRAQKFTEMHRIFKDIADLSANLGHTDFCARYDLILKLHKAFQEGHSITVSVGSHVEFSLEQPMPTSEQETSPTMDALQMPSPTATSATEQSCTTDCPPELTSTLDSRMEQSPMIESLPEFSPNTDSITEQSPMVDPLPEHSPKMDSVIEQPQRIASLPELSTMTDSPIQPSPSNVSLLSDLKSTLKLPARPKSRGRPRMAKGNAMGKRRNIAVTSAKKKFKLNPDTSISGTPSSSCMEVPSPQTSLKNIVKKELHTGTDIITYIQKTPVTELVNLIDECMQTRVGKPQNPSEMHHMAREEGQSALQFYLNTQAQSPETLTASTDAMWERVQQSGQLGKRDPSLAATGVPLAGALLVYAFSHQVRAVDLLLTLQDLPTHKLKCRQIKRPRIPQNSILRISNNSVTTTDLETLLPGNWLNDNVSIELSPH